MMENQFMYKGCTVSMKAAANQDDDDQPRVDVEIFIEMVATGKILLSETRTVESVEQRSVTLESALHHCATDARKLIDQVIG
jgi:hypothetical protein